MKVIPIKTHKITTKDNNIFTILDKYLGCHPELDSGSPEGIPGQARNDKIILKEKSVVAITSKIISFTQGQVISTDSISKEKLIEQEADQFLPRSSSKYDVQFTIKNNILTANAGIDESNANNQYVLWPKNPQECANKMREHLVKSLGLKKIGVIITDSKATPMRWGVTGISLAHSGFFALKDYIGTPDLFGRVFNFEKLNIADSLASAAVLIMGEGAEQTPIAVIEDIPMVEFQDRNPTDKELEELKISIEDDLYAPLLNSVEWKKGTPK